MEKWDIIGKPPIICRKQLQPLQVGHLFVLYETRSWFYPFAQFDEDSHADPLFLGILTCSQSGEQAMRWSAEGFPMVGYARWMSAIRKCDLKMEASNFWKYIRDGVDYPDINGTPGRPMTTPEHWLLALRLVKLGCGFDRIMNTVVRHAHCLLVAEAEFVGRVKPISQSDRDFVAWCNQQDQLADADRN